MAMLCRKGRLEGRRFVVGWSSMTGSDSSLSDRAATNLLTRNTSRPMRARMRLYRSQEPCYSG